MLCLSDINSNPAHWLSQALHNTPFINKAKSRTVTWWLSVQASVPIFSPPFENYCGDRYARNECARKLLPSLLPYRSRRIKARPNSSGSCYFSPLLFSRSPMNWTKTTHCSTRARWHSNPDVILYCRSIRPRSARSLWCGCVHGLWPIVKSRTYVRTAGEGVGNIYHYDRRL